MTNATEAPAAPPQLNARLDPRGVAWPARDAVRTATEVIATCVHLIGQSELARAPALAGSSMVISPGKDLAPDARRTLCEHWLLTKGFQELLRGIRASLEEAVLYTELVGQGELRTTQRAFFEYVAETRRRASKMTFPALLASVGDRLTAPLNYPIQIQSMQNARNCLEHRAGVVGEKDIDDQQVLTLSYPRLQAVYERGGVPIPIGPGAVVDTGDDRTEVTISVIVESVKKTFAFGQRIELSAAEFIEIAMACELFANDLAAKLPQVTPQSVPARQQSEAADELHQ